MEPVRSTRNTRVVEAARLHRVRERRRTGLTLLEGPHLLQEALAAGADIRHVFGLETETPVHGVTWIPVTEPVMERLAGTETPRGPVAVLAVPPPSPPRRDHLVLDIADPGNAGTLLRTAAAFGNDVVFRATAVDPWAPKVLRAAAGAHFRTRVASESDPTAGVIATVVDGGHPPDGLSGLLDPARTWSILVGSEAHGARPTDVASADVLVTIPMPGGTESLNAAVAGAIVAYELMRWRGAAGGPGPGH